MHKECPFDEYISDCNYNRDPSLPPAIQALFVFQEIQVAHAAEVAPLLLGHPGAKASFGNVVLESSTQVTMATKQDISLMVIPNGDSIDASVEFSADLFDHATIDRFCKSFQTMLAEVVGDAGRTVARMPLLPKEEEHQLMVTFNSTVFPHFESTTLRYLYEKQAARTPDAIAAFFEGEQLTYAQLNTRANSLAMILRQKHGVKPDVPVPIFCHRGLDMVVSVLAVLKAGGAYVPIDPSYPRDRISYVLEDSEATVALTETSLKSDFEAIGVPCSAICVDEFIKTLSPYGAPVGNLPENGLKPDHLSYIIYTSGSTGKPKGVAMTQLALVNLVQWQTDLTHEYELNLKKPRVVQFAPVAFDVSFQEMFTTWAIGGTLFLVTEALRLDAVNFLQFLETHKIERMFLPFVALQHFSEVAEQRVMVPSALKEVITAGEALIVTPAIRTFFSSLNNGKGGKLYNHYGPSESHVCTALMLDGDPHSWPMIPSIGFPVANSKIHILDEALQPVPIGVPGELYIGGKCLARGYHRRADLTAERFIPDPYLPHPSWSIDPPRAENKGRIYKTGDSARYLPDGQIEYMGRIDSQVKIRGFRVELGEVETVLGNHERIEQAVVVAHGTGATQKQLVAYFVSSKNQKVPINDLRQHMRQHLPEYMVPSIFMQIDRVPKTPSGKIDRKALPSPSLSQQQANEGEYVAPETETEKQVAEIWSAVLAVEKISKFDNFFNLGGHSLKVTRLASNLSDLFGMPLPLTVLYDHPVLTDQANAIDDLVDRQTQQVLQGRSQKAAVTVADMDAGNTPLLSYNQESLFFVSNLDPASNVTFNIPIGMRLSSDTSANWLAEAMQALVDRHPSLRTTYHTDADGHAFQQVHDEKQVMVVVNELPQPDHLRPRMVIDSRACFDLSTDSLVRLHVYRTSDGVETALIVFHHIAVDLWSIVLFFSELAEMRKAFIKDETKPWDVVQRLEPASVGYGQYAQWLLQWVRSQDGATHGAYVSAPLLTAILSSPRA